MKIPRFLLELNLTRQDYRRQMLPSYYGYWKWDDDYEGINVDNEPESVLLVRALLSRSSIQFVVC